MVQVCLVSFYIIIIILSLFQNTPVISHAHTIPSLKTHDLYIHQPMSPLMNTFLPPPRSDLFDVRLKRGHKPTWAARHSTYLQCGTHVLHFASCQRKNVAGTSALCRIQIYTSV